mgnify:CR=1 FL=1
MSASKLERTGAIAIALGGMIGGGIYAVFGVVARLTGPATWAAFVLAGAVATCAAYSFNALNSIVDDSGGSVTFVQAFVGNHTAAGMVGWTLLFGYVGSMAMYAFAFGEFTVGLPGVPDGVAGLPLRPLVSVGAVALFVGLNLAGTRSSGTAEVVLVAVKIAVLAAFGIGGVVFVAAVSPAPLNLGTEKLTSFSPVMAAAVSFVAFQGWQLLFYDQERIQDATETIRRAIYLSIPVAVAIYVLVGVATVSLAPQALEQHPHTALATAAGTILEPVGLAALGSLIISASALFSTGSAINATLFSAAYFSKNLLAHDLLPDRLGDADVDGIPAKTLLALGAITAASTAYGSLEAITTFASLAFLLVFGGMCYVALTLRDRELITPAIPALGLLGTSGCFVLVFVHLYRAQRGTFFAVLLLAVAVVAVELAYFERGVIEAEMPGVEAGSNG